jgi:sugar phosphate isomerase/epimerase
MKFAWTGFNNCGIDFWDMAEQCAKIGYKGVDGLFAMANGDVVENVKRCRALGIEPLTLEGGFDGPAGFDRKDAIDRIPKNIDLAHKLHINRVTFWNCSEVSHGFSHETSTYDELMQDIETINKAIQLYSAEGIDVVYHNHYQEFITYYKYVSVWDYILLNCDERLKFLPDVGWVHYAGVDVVKLLDRLGERVISLHVKEMAHTYIPNDNYDGLFTTLGTGVLPLKEILVKADSMGVPWAIVEQDRLNHLGPMETLAGSYYNAKETGVIE